MAATAMLAAGLDGVERGARPRRPNSANLYELSAAQREELGIELLPENLLDAIRELERGDVLRGALGETPDGDYVDYYYYYYLRQGQAARVAGGARADHPVRARAVPAAVLIVRL